MLGWKKHKLESRLPGEISITSDTQMTPPLWEKIMAPHSSTLAWEIPWMEERGRLQSMGSRRVGRDWVTSYSLSCTGGENGNPLQYSCLENPRDRVAWWAAIYGVAQSRTQLMRLSSSSSHPYGRKQRRTTEPLDESEREEWKSWLKTQHSEN